MDALLGNSADKIADLKSRADRIINKIPSASADATMTVSSKPAGDAASRLKASFGENDATSSPISAPGSKSKSKSKAKKNKPAKTGKAKK